MAADQVAVDTSAEVACKRFVTMRGYIVMKSIYAEKPKSTVQLVHHCCDVVRSAHLTKLAEFRTRDFLCHTTIGLHDKYASNCLLGKLEWASPTFHGPRGRSEEFSYDSRRFPVIRDHSLVAKDRSPIERRSAEHERMTIAFDKWGHNRINKILGYRLLAIEMEIDDWILADYLIIIDSMTSVFNTDASLPKTMIYLKASLRSMVIKSLMLSTPKFGKGWIRKIDRQRLHALIPKLLAVNADKLASTVDTQ
ncbi:hypothetical protein CLF_110028 [Clonorchis sinensis]|uniref:Uncharacterized protein n=1 Tax=Clonorchis sinensis TaxID=79923 RepID=G7YT47_CLOSI|nr:hypothetical protein CLF_110028 [Clonorchis sinensis]